MPQTGSSINRINANKRLFLVTYDVLADNMHDALADNVYGALVPPLKAQLMPPPAAVLLPHALFAERSLIKPHCQNVQ